jgi:trehalose 6-phosphate phosphatase
MFLDFDGTLAAIADDPDAVELGAHDHDALVDLFAELGGALAILSGRDIADLALRAPEGVWRIGGHGLATLSPAEAAADSKSGAEAGAAPAALTSAVEALVAPMDGVRVEIKGPILAVHYRAAPHLGEELARALEAIVSDHADYALQSGKMVFEAKPAHANKGAAVRALMARPPFAGRLPVMLGDDRTDEDAFAAAQALGGFGIKVGEGETAARYRLEAPAAVWAWLKTMRTT